MTTTLELFGGPEPGTRESIGRNAVVLRGLALPYVNALLPAIDDIRAQAPFRRMTTPGGLAMSVALTNCGTLGWVSDRRGYRYSRLDPDNARPWPPMPQTFHRLAREAAADAGFEEFEPDACLVNHYVPGSRLSLHQDKDELDFGAPIVSVSLGMAAIFLFGGRTRSDKVAKIGIYHGDVVVWGGVDRLRYHGVKPLEDQPHPLLGSQRINLTFRKTR